MMPNNTLQPIPINGIGTCSGPGGAPVSNLPLSPGMAER